MTGSAAPIAEAARHRRVARPALSWHAVALLPHAEALAADQLARQGYCVFAPTIERTIRHARQFRTKIVPMFPGYFFVRLDLASASWRGINGTRGVRRLVMAGDRPARMPDLAIQALGGDMHTPAGLEPGAALDILAGPFSGLGARLECLDGAARVTVLMELLGGAVRVTLPREAVRLAG